MKKNFPKVLNFWKVINKNLKSLFNFLKKTSYFTKKTFQKFKTFGKLKYLKYLFLQKP